MPVKDRPRSHLIVSEKALASLRKRFSPDRQYALLHPASLFFTKQWSAENFARVAEYLDHHDISSVAVASKNERMVLGDFQAAARVPVFVFDDLTLPEITALASNATVFVGNDSGIAHIAAAVDTPTVVVFGSSNRNHWRPWTDTSNEIVFNEFACQPCPGYECKVYGEPKCILSVDAEQVIDAVKRVLSQDKKGEPQPALLTID
jgi:heptosyltransferase-2/heptosyltransferase-3